ncbi:MAG TPA: Gfo/Idh/MocA family oxidoreductase [Terriglobia bacterium]|nr:Gfo/Idh/MocA family oxidoreductase [Terriglobia bacterium]
MKSLGVGIIGTGWVSGEHIKAFEANPHTEVRGIVSRDEARAAAKAQEYGLAHCRAYGHLEGLLNDPDIHVVSICTPHHLHAAQGIAGAKAGKHLMLEKPVALDLASLRELQAAVRAAKVKTVVSFVLRWNPLFETLKALLADGVVGQLFYAEVDYLHGIGPWYAQYEWNIKKEIGGSSLLTGGCHAADGLRWFVGKRAVEVFAYANFSPRNPLAYEYEPNSVTLVKFEDGTLGKVASSVESVMPYVFNIELLGDGGSIRNNQVFSKRWVGQKGWATIPTVLPDSGDVSHHPFKGQVNHFVDCILNDRESHANLEDAAQTHEICFASEISARERRPVALPL